MKALCLHQVKPKKLTALLMGLIVFSYFFYVQNLPTELNSYSKNYDSSKNSKLSQAGEENFDMYQKASEEEKEVDRLHYYKDKDKEENELVSDTGYAHNVRLDQKSESLNQNDRGNENYDEYVLIEKIKQAKDTADGAEQIKDYKLDKEFNPVYNDSEKNSTGKSYLADLTTAENSTDEYYDPYRLNDTDYNNESQYIAEEYKFINNITTNGTNNQTDIEDYYEETNSTSDDYMNYYSNSTDDYPTYYEDSNSTEDYVIDYYTTDLPSAYRNITHVQFGNVNFDINSTDMIVFLHMQKTGGTTFGRHLVKDLILQEKCRKLVETEKRWDCGRPNNKDEQWLFSRYTTGWRCGLHADWTNLIQCAHRAIRDYDHERRYFYFTILREPVARYLSEFAHVRRGATWDTAFSYCNNKKRPMPKCYDGYNWLNVSLDEFASCHDNWANNRQTRMLADLRLVNCDGSNMTSQQFDDVLLESAKRNLLKISFFGLTEEQEKSRIMFEKVFDLKFRKKFQLDLRTRASMLKPSEEQLEKIKENNKLDIELYKFAKELFYERWNKIEVERPVGEF